MPATLPLVNDVEKTRAGPPGAPAACPSAHPLAEAGTTLRRHAVCPLEAVRPAGAQPARTCASPRIADVAPAGRNSILEGVARRREARRRGVARRSHKHGVTPSLPTGQAVRSSVAIVEGLAGNCLRHAMPRAAVPQRQGVRGKPLGEIRKSPRCGPPRSPPAGGTSYAASSSWPASHPREEKPPSRLPLCLGTSDQH